jgi:hypothetical protein
MDAEVLTSLSDGSLASPPVKALLILGGSLNPKPIPDVPDKESPIVIPVVGLLAPSVAGGVIGGPEIFPNSAIVGVFNPDGKLANGPNLGEARPCCCCCSVAMTAAGPVCTP